MLNSVVRASKIVLVVLGVGWLGSGFAQSDVIRLSEPVYSDAHSEVFGSPMPTDRASVALADVLATAADHVGKTVLVDARIGKVCQKKGCFFIAQDGSTSARVSFKDYGFFVPTNVSGRQVTLAAELVQVDLSPAQAQHFQQDAGGDADIRAGVSYELVATAVRIPR
ncbi:MAG: DUF4920 domain-containing protein [Pseudomonadota bacterium]